MENIDISGLLPHWTVAVLAILGSFEAARLVAYLLLAMSRELRRQIVHTSHAAGAAHVEYRTWRALLSQLSRGAKRAFRRDIALAEGPCAGRRRRPSRRAAISSMRSFLHVRRRRLQTVEGHRPMTTDTAILVGRRTSPRS